MHNIHVYLQVHPCRKVKCKTIEETTTHEFQYSAKDLSQAIRTISFSGDTHIPAMNVSKNADAEFMRLLEKEDPKRYAAFAKNMRSAARGGAR